MSDNRSSRKTSKVQRVIDEYGLAGLGDRLEAHWLGDDDEQYSLRQLADLFNQEVLRAALTNAGVSTLDGEIENTHRLLTSDDVSSGVRTETENALKRDGIDIERLKQDFVSHQAVHTYLTKYRSVSYQSQADEPAAQLEKGASTIQRLRNRTAAVTETTLDNLRNTDRITLGDFELFVDLRVVCNTCGQSYAVDELLREGGCDCAAETD
ncbi:rod-determining factor RdfA [Haladaptatus salinisoli]|uniref:rod-determining factor RdfA n=1 Tax=Haladaptatus salinisoli TaxID=2884876 RepID=UPI001D0B5148|nr:rod-determining factor RdfA [Haladaptatus salinisoli]